MGGQQLWPWMTTGEKVSWVFTPLPSVDRLWWAGSHSPAFTCFPSLATMFSNCEPRLCLPEAVRCSVPATRLVPSTSFYWYRNLRVGKQLDNQPGSTSQRVAEPGSAGPSSFLATFCPHPLSVGPAYRNPVLQCLFHLHKQTWLHKTKAHSVQLPRPAPCLPLWLWHFFPSRKTTIFLPFWASYLSWWIPQWPVLNGW